MERPLRAHNRKATLSLEYEFGRVASHMSQSGSGQAANGMASRLADRLERVLATMPVAAPDTGAAAAVTECFCVQLDIFFLDEHIVVEIRCFCVDSDVCFSLC